MSENSDPVQVRQRELEGDGVRLMADVAGADGARPVLFLHGGGQTRGSWRNAITAVAARGFLGVAIDLRGHGESEHASDGDYRLARFSNDIRKIAPGLGPRPFLVGASLGGLAALLAVAEPPPVDAGGLVLVDIVPRMEEAGAKRIVDFMRSAPDGFASLEEAGAAVSGYLPHRKAPPNLEGLRRNLRLGDDGRWRWHWDPRFLQGWSGSPKQAGDRLEAAARALTLPTLLVRGGRSDVVSKEGAEGFLKIVPHAEFVDVAGADHMVAGDRNDAFNGAIAAFLERHRT